MSADFQEGYQQYTTGKGQCGKTGHPHAKKLNWTLVLHHIQQKLTQNSSKT